MKEVFLVSGTVDARAMNGDDIQYKEVRGVYADIKAAYKAIYDTGPGGQSIEVVPFGEPLKQPFSNDLEACHFPYLLYTPTDGTWIIPDDDHIPRYEELSEEIDRWLVVEKPVFSYYHRRAPDRRIRGSP